MPRARRGAARHQARKRILKAVKGYRGPAGRQIRLAKEALVRAEANAFTDRRRRKRDFRRLWILRLNAACRQHGLRYSQFVDGCKKADIALNRKMLSELAIADPAAFAAVLDKARAALA